MTKTAAPRTAALLLPFLVLVALAPGCRKQSISLSPDAGSSDEALYKIGEVEIKRDMEKGILYLRQVIDSFPKSFYAQRAKILIADAYFRKGDESNMILAAAEYREFIRTYPYSPSAAYSQYQIAMTFFRKMLKPGRDPSKTIQALAEFKKVLADYPASDQAKPAQERIKV
jgi:outer membrane protein assembly factor BamD